MSKILVAIAVTAFAVTASTQDKPKVAPTQKECTNCPKEKQTECKGEKACEKKGECKKADCPKTKKA